MPDSEQASKLQAALRFVIASDSMSDHKGTLIDALLQALRGEESATVRRRDESLDAGRAWEDRELEQLSAFLKDRVARSWQDADAGVMHIAAQLHRDPRSVRDKATELGFSAAVDYRFATSRREADKD